MTYVFIDDDPGFVRWRDAHPSGYIINAERKPKARYLILHRADCGHITSPSRTNWTKQYIKICSTDVSDLIQWAEREVPGYRALHACRSCNP